VFIVPRSASATVNLLTLCPTFATVFFNGPFAHREYRGITYAISGFVATFR
jgi:hypothetical protein